MQFSKEKTEHIAGEIAKKVLESVPLKAGKISGEDILTYHSHKQVNLFVMFQLNQELAQQLGHILKSGIDTEKEEVVSALKQFQSVISRHMLLREEELHPRLVKAIYNSLRLIQEPKAHLVQFFFSGNATLPVEAFNRIAAYFSDFDFVIGSLAKYFEKNEIKTIEASEFESLFDRVVEIFEKKENQSFDDFRTTLLEKSFGLKPEFFQEAPAKEETREEKEKKSIAETYTRAQKIDIYSLESAPIEKPVVVSPKPIEAVVPVPVVEAKIEQAVEAIAPPIVQEAKVEHPEMKEAEVSPMNLFSQKATSKPEAEKSSFLHQKFQQEKKPAGLNENIKEEQSNTIPVHKQFQIIQKVFKGNNIRYKAVIDKIAEANTQAEAEEILEKFVFNTPEIDRQDPVSIEFAAFVRARF